MKSHVFIAATAILFCAAMISADGQGPATKPSIPTYSKDVAPILFKNCSGCHRPGEIGPMPLLNYTQARPWAKSIKAAVAKGTMPPWHATAARGTFSNDRRLTNEERETIIAWVDGGAV